MTEQNRMNKRFEAEKGWTNGGLYTPAEIRGRLDTFDAREPVTRLLEGLEEYVDPARDHEILHCFDVGFGAAALTRQIASDSEAMGRLGIGEITENHIRQALYTGLAHDAALAIDANHLPKATPWGEIALQTGLNFRSRLARPQYAKDDIGDDLRGAILLRDNLVGAGCIAYDATSDLLAGSDCQVHHVEQPRKLLGSVSPYKVLDAIWYHDGNWPVRGVAEGYALVGDRVELFKEGCVDEAVVIAGIEKLLKYTDPDPEWLQRDTKVDVPYLERWVAKKAGPFMQVIKGTQTYDFVVEELAAQGRGMRTVRSPAFHRGVDAMFNAHLLLLEVTIPKSGLKLDPSVNPKVEALYQRWQEADAIIKSYRCEHP